MEPTDVGDIIETRKPHFLDEDYVPLTDSSNKIDSSDTHDKSNIMNSKSLNNSRSGENRKSHDHNRTYFATNDVESLFMPDFTSRGTWPIERGMSSWTHNNHQTQSCNKSLPLQFHSYIPNSEMFGSKVKCVYSLLSMLSSHNSIEMSEQFLEMSKNLDSCIAMRQSGCIPLLVQLVRTDPHSNTKQKAALALYNVICANPDDKSGRREAKVLKLLEKIWDFCDILRFQLSKRDNDIESNEPDDLDIHPTSVIGVLTKISFDEEHRHAMCDLGALHTIADMITLDHAVHGNITHNQNCITIRRHAGMALTNLTFGDGKNKSLLCSFKDFLKALIAQLYSSCDELMQTSASVLRNMSWRADSSSKQLLRDAGAVLGLTHAAMKGKKETTLNSILSALWNLSAHCSLNKMDICSVEGALGFLVDMLKYKAPSKTLAIVENAGGILRNVSSHIAVREDYREILRHHNCLAILLQQLKSPSLIIVSNACGTLWNLSARNSTDQQFLWENGAVPLLRSLIYSKHKMISMGSGAALKNLLNTKPGSVIFLNADHTTKILPTLPILGVRKQKSLQEVLDQDLSETCEDIEHVSSTSSRYNNIFTNLCTSNELANKRLLNTSAKGRNWLSLSCGNSLLQEDLCSETLDRSESKDSITSAQSDSVYETTLRRYLTTIPDYQNKTKYVDKTIKLNSVNLNGGVSNNLMKKKDDIVGFNERTKDNQHKIQFFNVPLRSNCIENICVENIQEEPIDYSRKYCEPKIDSSLQNVPSNIRTVEENSFGDYQETDLDQPTDYSLRYGENTSYSIPDLSKQSSIKEYYEEQESNFVHEDSVKCYYTEGTPYESTPYNFSNIASMTDMRMIQIECSKKEKDKSRIKEISEKVHVDMTASDEKDTCSDHNDAAIERTHKSENNYCSKFSSGIGSPEKPTNYCEEGTPGYFSRFSSLSSLDEFNELRLKYDVIATGINEANFEKSPKASKDVKENNVKVVSFVPVAPDYVQETPLMFSRSSSIGSLSSIEQHGVVDDHNSVISEFSRLTSGIISPSELPDSPTQAAQQQSANDKTNKGQVSTYAEEGTPVEFSCATSLSALTIEDGDPGPYDNKTVKSSNTSIGNEQQLVSEGDEEDEHILAACINIGMQKHHTEMIPMHSTPKYAHKVDDEGIHLYCAEDTPSAVLNAASVCDTDLLYLNRIRATDEMSLGKDQRTVICAMEGNLSDVCNLSAGDGDLLGNRKQVGKPKPTTQTQKRASSIPTPSNKKRSDITNYLNTKDEVALYAIETTPQNFSACSSISDLTINSIDKPVMQLICGSDDVLNKYDNISHEQTIQKALCSSNTADILDVSDHRNQYFERAIMEKKNEANEASAIICDSSNQNSHSFSSSSVESFESPDSESSLFEQCIKSGLPRSNMRRVAARSLTKKFNEQSNQNKAVTVSTKHIRAKSQSVKKMSSFIPTSKIRRSSSETRSSFQQTDDMALLEECIYTGMPKRKLEDKIKLGQNKLHRQTSDNNLDPSANYDKLITQMEKRPTDYKDNANTIEQPGQVIKNIKHNSWIEPSTSNDMCCETTFKAFVKFGNDKLSPNNIYQKSETFTNNIKVDLRNDFGNRYSWNTLFPSVDLNKENRDSNSARYDNNQEKLEELLDKSKRNISVIPNNKLNTIKQNFDKVMSNSSIIEYEASKLVSALENGHSMTNSTLSLCIDEIKPPSPMGSIISLSRSACSNVELNLELEETNLENHDKIIRNPLSGNVLVKRIFNSYVFHNRDNLEQSSYNDISSYNLDSVKPPSVMNDLDMDDSTNSISSIISEVDDSKFDQSPSLKHSAQYNSSDIKDVNPPSFITDPSLEKTSFNSTDICTNNTKKCTEGSLHSPNRKSITPKQNRQISKERYLTYTLQQDLFIYNNKSDKSENSLNDITIQAKSSACASLSKSKLRKTSKQRRREDHARFRTQVLDVSVETLQLKSLEPHFNMKANIEVNQKLPTHNESSEIKNMRKRISNADNVNTEEPERQINLDHMLVNDNDLVLGILSDSNQSSSSSTKSDRVTSMMQGSSELNISDEPNKPQNGFLDITQIAESRQSKSYIICHKNQPTNDTLLLIPKIPRSPQKVNKETITKIVRPRNKTSYISPYRNIYYRQQCRENISKSKINTNNRLDPKATLSAMISTKPTFSRVGKTIQYESDNVKNRSPNFINTKSDLTNTVIVKQKTKNNFTRQNTFTKDETNQMGLLPSESCQMIAKKQISKQRVSAIPCKLPKSTQAKELPKCTSIRKHTIKYNDEKSITTVAIHKSKLSVNSTKTGIPSTEAIKLISTNVKPIANVLIGTNTKFWEKSSNKFANIYKRSEIHRFPENNSMIAKVDSDHISIHGKKPFQRSQTFDNRATDKCGIAHATKQKSSIGIRPPQSLQHKLKKGLLAFLHHLIRNGQI